MVLQVAALPILCVVPHVTTRSVLYAKPVNHAGYSNVHPRHVGRCNDVSAEFRMFYFSDPWFVKYLETVKVEEVCCGCAVRTLCILVVF